MVLQRAPVRLHRFRKTISEVRNVAITGDTAFDALTIQLNAVTGSTDLAAVFDQYRLRKCSCHLDFSRAETAAGTELPYKLKVYTAPDYDDANIGGITLAQFLSKEKLQSKFIGDRDSYIKKGSLPLYVTQPMTGMGTAPPTGYAPVRSPWLDMAQRGVPHGSLKYCIDFGTPALNGQVYEVPVTFELEFECRAGRA